MRAPECYSANYFGTYLGNVRRDLKLNFEKGTQVEISCGATLNGQHWIIGGYSNKKQVSHLQKSH